SNVYPCKAFGSLIASPSLTEGAFGSAFLAAPSLPVAGLRLASWGDAGIPSVPSTSRTATMRPNWLSSRVVRLLRGLMTSFPVESGRGSEQVACLHGSAKLTLLIAAQRKSSPERR